MFSDGSELSAKLRGDVSTVKGSRCITISPDVDIVTLCGSTRFKDTFMEEAQRLTFDGCIVLTPCVFTKSDGIDIDPGTLNMLKELHYKKIDISSKIFVINPGGYIGESTKEEIAYAVENGKVVEYMVNPEGESDYES